MLRRMMLLVGTTSLAIFLLLPASAVGKTIGGCPASASGKWELVSVASLGITPGEASGIPSLDGNNDGMTCIKPVSGGFVFRDNTV